MHELDFHPVGDGERSGDAITGRLTRPDNGQTAVFVVDAGFQDDGEAIVEHVREFYGVSRVDLAISTHPDGDHIGGMGRVLRDLSVRELWLHRPAVYGYDGPAADVAEELAELAGERGTRLRQPFTGVSALGGAVLVAGPSKDFYCQMLAEQVVTAKHAVPVGVGARIAEALSTVADRALGSLPVEIPFGDGDGTNPRNNSGTILDFVVGGKRLLLTSDTGVRALSPALDYLESTGRAAIQLSLVQLPHHGSRHNLDRDTIERLVGGPGSGKAIVSLAESAPAKYPSGRVANAFLRRGFPVFATRGQILCDQGAGAPRRWGWGPATPLPPLAEEED